MNIEPFDSIALSAKNDMSQNICIWRVPRDIDQVNVGGHLFGRAPAMASDPVEGVLGQRPGTGEVEQSGVALSKGLEVGAVYFSRPLHRGVLRRVHQQPTGSPEHGALARLRQRRSACAAAGLLH